MAWTKRPENRCKNCGATWFPKGKNLSRKCPECGSANVSYKQNGCGCLALIVLGVIAYGLYGGSQKPAVVPAAAPSPVVLPVNSQTPEPSVTAMTAPVTPLPPAKVFSTEAEAQREAMRRYPALGVAGSTMNADFVDLVRSYRITKPEYFKDPGWPVHLAEDLHSGRVVAPTLPNPATPAIPAGSTVDPHSFIGMSEAALTRQLGTPLKVIKDPSPDGPFTMYVYPGAKGKETFFTVFASDGFVSSGMYQGVAFH